jgi:hypothetical protein
MTNRELHKALLEKLGITPQGLSFRVQKLKRKHAITTEDATYIIAQQERIIISRYLDAETVNHVRTVMQQIPPINQTATTKTTLVRKDKKDENNKRININFPTEFKVQDPILNKNKIEEAKDMAVVYPLLYVLENSIRETIDRVMVSRYGDNWWDSKAPSGLKEAVGKRMTDEERNCWHQRRGARPIDYLDLNQLPALIRKIEKDFIPNIIPSIEWFTEFINEIYRSRCVVCHMNPLDQDNVQLVKLRFRHWQKQINVKRNKLI